MRGRAAFFPSELCGHFLAEKRNLGYSHPHRRLNRIPDAARRALALPSPDGADRLQTKTVGPARRGRVLQQS